MTHRSRVIATLFCTLMLDMVSMGIVIPVVATIFTDPHSTWFLLTGYPEYSWAMIAGAVTALFAVMQFFAAPLLGELSDIYGRKRLLTIGVTTLAVSQWLFGIGILASSLALLFIARAIAGLAAANFSIAQATIADISTPETRAQNFGLIGAAFGLGFIIGPLLGGWLTHIGTAATPFWFAGVLGICNTLLITRFLPETRHVSERTQHTFTLLKGFHNIRSAFKDRHSLPLYLTSFAYVTGFGFFTSFSGIYLVGTFGLTPGELGSYFAVIGAWVVCTQGILLRFVAARYSERAIVRVTLLAMGASLACYGFIPSALLHYLFVPCIAIPQGLTMASMGALISKSVSKEKQGAALGINGSFQALGGGIAPLAGGIVSAVISSAAPFYIAACLCVIAWSVLFVFLKHTTTHP